MKKLILLLSFLTIAAFAAGPAYFDKINLSGQLTSTVTTGTAPLVIGSTTQVANLNAATAGTATNANNGATTAVSNSATYYPLFVSSSSNSNQAFNLGTGLTFNPSTNVLTTTTFSGALSGTATNATNVATTAVSNSATYYPLFVSSSSNGNQAPNLGTGLTFNPNTNNLSTTTFTGALSGNATTATSATSATTASSATKSTNLAGGNSTTLLGSVPYQSDTDTTTLLGPNTTTTKKFFRQTGNGTNGAAPAWDTIAAADYPTMVGDSGAGGTKGAVPAPASGDAAANKYLKADGNWTAVVAGGSGTGAINYITNYNAETDTTGWATYADAAGTSPVNGTAGSPTVTFTRTTSSPLRNTGSFLITKDAANRQGEGASYDFTIDSADQGRVLQISFDYAIASGTYVDGDQTVWIYDVTNAALIQPAGTSILNAVGTQPQKATFQAASNSTSYRLIFHTTSTSASAYTVKLDNVLVGPQVTTYGPAVTDWKAYTPTYVGFGTVTSANAEYRRVGDSVQIRGRFSSGTSTAVAAQISLPAGLTIDSSKITNNESVGKWNTNSTATNGFLFSGTTYLNMSIETGINANNGNAIAASGGVVLFYSDLLPIVGFSSNSVVSSDTDTRIVSFKGSNTASTSIANSGATAIPFVASDDSHGAWNGTDTYTVPVSGRYRIAASAIFANGVYVVGDGAYLSIVKNGSIDTYGYEWTAGTTTSIAASVILATTVKCNAGDTLILKANNGRTAGATALNSTAGVNTLSIERISGPSQIAASEYIACRYGTTNSNSTTNTSVDVVENWTKEFDTHSIFNATTGIATVPVSGTYRISATLTGANTAYTTGAGVFSFFKVSGTKTVLLMVAGIWASQTNYLGLSGSTIVHYNAGDTISISLGNYTGSTITLDGLASDNWVTIERVGN